MGYHLLRCAARVPRFYRLLTGLVLVLTLAGCTPADMMLPDGAAAESAAGRGTVPPASATAVAGDEETDDAGSTGAELIPLALDNRWTYTDQQSGETVTNQVDMAQIIGDETWYRMNEFNGYVWVRNVEGGQLDAFYADEDALTPEEAATADLFFRHPMEDGAGYVPYADESGVMSYTRREEPCRVPVGEFACVRFVLTEPDLTLTWHIAPGVGIVEHTYAEDGAVDEHWVLTEYALDTE